MAKAKTKAAVKSSKTAKRKSTPKVARSPVQAGRPTPARGGRR